MTCYLVGSFYRDNLSGFLNNFSVPHTDLKKKKKKTRFHKCEKYIFLFQIIHQISSHKHKRENYLDQTFKIEKEKILTQPSGLLCLVLSLQLNDIWYISTFSGQVLQMVVEKSYQIVTSKPLYNTY